MADFTRALPYVLKHEGGFSNDPDDPGGATNYGITLAVAQMHGVGTVAELKAITAAKVAQIYRADYWRFNGVSNQAVATKIFDLAVNMGIHTATHLVQEILEGLGVEIQVDDCWGPRTEAAVNAISPDRMLALLCRAALEHYQALAERRPRMAKFLPGWTRRALEVPRG